MTFDEILIYRKKFLIKLKMIVKRRISFLTDHEDDFSLIKPFVHTVFCKVEKFVFSETPDVHHELLICSRINLILSISQLSLHFVLSLIEQ